MDNTQLEKRITALEQQLKKQSSLIDFFSNQIVFKKKVKFNTTVYDKNGGIVTEINP